MSLSVEHSGKKPVRAKGTSHNVSKTRKVSEPRQSAKVTAKAEFTGISDKKKPVTCEDVWKFVKEYAGNQAYNVEIVPLENVAMEAERPLPFTRMEGDGRRSQVMWALVNGCGRDKDRRLSSFLSEALKHGASTKRCPDLVAALNGGYSSSSKSWGTPFIKLRVKE